VTPAKKTVVCRRNGTGFGRDHRCAAGFTENLGLFEVPKLKSLAANADVFAFAWKSSKHQAYFAAKEARGSRQTLLPVGKGSASILDCVLKELES
jgi:hypothetical protein